MAQDMPWWRAIALVGVVLWLIGAMFVSLSYIGMLAWAWPNFVETALTIQVLAWTVVLAPILGIALAVILSKTLKKHALTAITTTLVIQVVALFTPMLVS